MVAEAADGGGVDVSSHAGGQQPGSDRSFGLVFAGVFALFAVLPLLHHGRTRLWAIAVSACFLAAALLKPALLKHLNRAWFLLGLAIGKVVTPVMMGLIFLVALTPVAMLRRGFKSKGLDTSFDRNVDSYWIPREQAVRSFKQQF